jgi:nucleotide-binding universal stress UspA family protein
MSTPGIARILVATDFSETSEFALDYAKAMAERFGACIHLLHVLEEPPALSTVTEEGFAAEWTALCTARHERRRQRLQRLASVDEGIRFCATGEVRTGRAPETICDVALKRGADLIVMGTHGRGGVAHLLLGSVAEKVVRIAPSAVLTVRPGIAGSPAARGETLSYQRATSVRRAETQAETL